jgi:hypothetical protein
VATNRRTGIATLALATVALTGCTSTAGVAPDLVAPAPPITASPATPNAAPVGWTKVAPWPYAAWYNALTAWTGTEVLNFGGWLDRGPGASGPPPSVPVSRAAGAYNPATNTWRTIAVTPFSQYEATIVAAGQHAYALAFDASFGGGLTKAHLWEYSVAGNAWRQLADPPLRFAAAARWPPPWPAGPGRASR